MQDRRLSFSDWCLAVDRRVIEIDHALEYALSGSSPRFVGGRFERSVPDISNSATWYNQRRTVHVFSLDARAASVSTMSIDGSSFPAFDVILYECTVDDTAVEMASYLTLRNREG